MKEEKEEIGFEDTPMFDIEIIKPKQNCQMCLGRGWYNFWSADKVEVIKTKTKKGYKRERKHQPERQPCSCLSKQYRKKKTTIKPKFDEVDGKVVIRLETPIKQEDVASVDEIIPTQEI